MDEWIKVYREMVDGLSMRVVADMVGRNQNTARNWYAGRTIPDAVAWKRLVAERGRTYEWAALLAARETAASARPKRGAVAEDPAVVLRRRAAKLRAKAAELEAQAAILAAPENQNGSHR